MFEEYISAFESYIDTVKDPNKLLYNLTHNMGNIYDLIVEAVQRLY